MKVITDNLDWVGFKKGDILTQDDDGYWSVHEDFAPRFSDDKFKKLLKLHPDWFEEINPKWTDENMVSFGEFVNSKCRCKDKYQGWGYRYLTEWIEKCDC